LRENHGPLHARGGQLITPPRPLPVTMAVQVPADAFDQPRTGHGGGAGFCGNFLVRFKFRRGDSRPPTLRRAHLQLADSTADRIRRIPPSCSRAATKHFGLVFRGRSKAKPHEGGRWGWGVGFGGGPRGCEGHLYVDITAAVWRRGLHSRPDARPLLQAPHRRTTFRTLLQTHDTRVARRLHPYAVWSGRILAVAIYGLARTPMADFSNRMDCCGPSRWHADAHPEKPATYVGGRCPVDLGATVLIGCPEQLKTALRLR